MSPNLRSMNWPLRSRRHYCNDMKVGTLVVMQVLMLVLVLVVIRKFQNRRAHH